MIIAKFVIMIVGRFSESGNSENLDVDSTVEFRFLCAQIALYGKLAFERNSFAIEAITQGGFLDWDTAFFCLRVRRQFRNEVSLYLDCKVATCR